MGFPQPMPMMTPGPRLIMPPPMTISYRPVPYYPAWEAEAMENEAKIEKLKRDIRKKKYKEKREDYIDQLLDTIDKQKALLNEYAINMTKSKKKSVKETGKELKEKVKKLEREEYEKLKQAEKAARIDSKIFIISFLIF